MNGLVIRDTPIAVDFWNIRECHGARLFFLSHFHADHMCQLTSSWRYPIYCDPITAKLLVEFKKIDKNLTIPLEPGSPCIIPLDDVNGETMTVTTFDASHCPGSVMFLFQGYFGNILYTGDFRYENVSLLAHPVFQCGRLRIDRLYLDNTYCSPSCTGFPTRQQATEEIVNLVRRHHDARIFIGMRKLGKESLLLELAHQFHSPILVSPDEYRKMELLDCPQVFTTDENASRISTVPFHEVTPTRCRRYLRENCQSLFILPTCLFWNQGGALSESHPKVWPNGVEVKVVNYSDHSSFDELCLFVARVRPCQIEAIVSCGDGVAASSGPPHDNSPVAVFEKLLSKELPLQFEIPRSVQLYMGKSVGRPAARMASFQRANAAKKIASVSNRTSVGVVFCDDDSDESSGEMEMCNGENSDSDRLRTKELSVPIEDIGREKSVNLFVAANQEDRVEKGVQSISDRMHCQTDSVLLARDPLIGQLYCSSDQNALQHTKAVSSSESFLELHIASVKAVHAGSAKNVQVAEVSKVSSNLQAASNQELPTVSSLQKDKLTAQQQVEFSPSVTQDEPRSVLWKPPQASVKVHRSNERFSSLKKTVPIPAKLPMVRTTLEIIIERKDSKPKKFRNCVDISATPNNKSRFAKKPLVSNIANNRCHPRSGKSILHEKEKVTNKMKVQHEKNASIRSMDLELEEEPTSLAFFNQIMPNSPNKLATDKTPFLQLDKVVDHNVDGVTFSDYLLRNQAVTSTPIKPSLIFENASTPKQTTAKPPPDGNCFHQPSKDCKLGSVRKCGIADDSNESVSRTMNNDLNVFEVESPGTSSFSSCLEPPALVTPQDTITSSSEAWEPRNQTQVRVKMFEHREDFVDIPESEVLQTVSNSSQTAMINPEVAAVIIHTGDAKTQPSQKQVSANLQRQFKKIGHVPERVGHHLQSSAPSTSAKHLLANSEMAKTTTNNADLSDIRNDGPSYSSKYGPDLQDIAKHCEQTSDATKVKAATVCHVVLERSVVPVASGGTKTTGNTPVKLSSRNIRNSKSRKRTCQPGSVANRFQTSSAADKKFIESIWTKWSKM